MKTIEIDEDIYYYIASKTQHIGESASDILRRILLLGIQPPTPLTEKKLAPLDSQKFPLYHRKIMPAPKQQCKIDAVRNLLYSADYALHTKAVNRFIYILSTLYALDAAAFADSAIGHQGRTRIYFADDKKILLDTGIHAKPRLIPGTPYWVITNTNTNRKRSMLGHIMRGMAIPEALIETLCNTL